MSTVHRRSASDPPTARGAEALRAALVHALRYEDAFVIAQALTAVAQRAEQARSGPLQGWWALTRAERRVAQLVAGGHSNRSAGALLSVSPSTVATHLRSIFSKLDVSTRVAMTRRVLVESRGEGSLTGPRISRVAVQRSGAAGLS